MAGNGWMRGVQDAVKPLRYVLAANVASAILCPVLVYVVGWGLPGSAVANVACQLVGAALFLRALRAEHVPLRPQPRTILAQLKLGRDLVVRSLAFQVTGVAATSVAARTSAEAAGAHQVVLQLWSFLAMVLDSLAIAAQALVGAALGAGSADQARSVARRITGYGLVLGTGLGVVFAALAGILPRAFTADPGVLAQIPLAWWIFVLLQPIAGVVFALDGVFLGAGDAAFLRTATILAAFLGYLPMIVLSLILRWGLVGIWTGLSLMMVIRLVTLLIRQRSGRWAVVGADLAKS